MIEEFISVESIREKPLADEMEINNLQDKEFKSLVIRILTELEKRIAEHSENINKELENIKRNQSHVKDVIMEMKNTLEGINNTVGDTEKHVKWSGRQNNGNHHLKMAKRKTNFKN